MTADTAPQEGVKNTDPFAQDYTLNHTMLRIKDPKPSLAFYCTLLGMSLIRKIDVAPGKFTLYFLGYLDPETEIPTDRQEQVAFVFQQRGLLELTHNWGTEEDPEQSYHDGNADPRGFGHIGISVPDVAACCDRLEAAGCSFVKRPDEGMMKGLAFVRDPDGYWVEILSARRMSGQA